MSSIDEFNQSLRTFFQAEYSDFTYKQWIAPVTIRKIDQHYLYIEVPSQTYANYWRNNILKDVMEKGYDYFNIPFEPKFIIASSETPSHEEAYPEIISEVESQVGAREEALPPAQDDSTLLNSKYTFKNFILGKGNTMAHAVSLVVCEKPGELYNPLFIYGGVGLGKTHLMHAIGNYSKELRPNLRVKYVTSEDFTNEMIAAITNKTTAEFRNRYRNVDLLLVDDIQFFATKEATQEEFFHTFNALFNHQKQIVLTSDRPPREINKLQDRLVSRFSSGLPVDITPPDLETRIAILNSKAAAIGLSIQPGPLAYIAGQIHSNVRELEGALIRVQAYSVSHGEDITTDLVAQALKNFLPGDQDRIVTIQDILQEVAKFYSVPPQDLLGKKRTKTIVEPRQVAMYLSRELTKSSLPKIGTEFGKDHSTVLHAYDKIAEEVAKGEQVAQTIDLLKKQLGF